MKPAFLKIASVSGIIAVILGAFGAHTLKDILSPSQLAAFETAVRYQFIHTLALLAVFILLRNFKNNFLVYAGSLFTAGIIFFSGSIYILATQSLLGINAGFLGPVTPLGGLLLIGGWVCLLLFAFKIKNE